MQGNSLSLVDEHRILGELARDSLSNLALMLRKTAPSLDAPEELASCLGMASGGEGTGGQMGTKSAGGLLVELVGVFDQGDQEVVASVCGVFEVGVGDGRCYRGRWPSLVPIPRAGQESGGGGRVIAFSWLSVQPEGRAWFDTCNGSSRMREIGKTWIRSSLSEAADEFRSLERWSSFA